MKEATYLCCPFIKKNLIYFSIQEGGNYQNALRLLSEKSNFCPWSDVMSYLKLVPSETFKLVTGSTSSSMGENIFLIF